VSDPSTLLPELAAFPDQDEALVRLRAAWQRSEDPVHFAEVIQGALAYPDHHPMVPLALRLAAHAPALDVDLELRTLWEGWKAARRGSHLSRGVRFETPTLPLPVFRMCSFV
jgi:hypothetical protein